MGMDAIRSIYNGGSSCLINRDVTTNYVTDIDNPLTVQQMRRAAKDILYTGVNSRGHGFGLGTGIFAERWLDLAVRFWKQQR